MVEAQPPQETADMWLDLVILLGLYFYMKQNSSPNCTPRPKQRTAISCLQQALVELQHFKLCHASFPPQRCYCIDVKKCFLGRRFKKVNKQVLHPGKGQPQGQTKVFPAHHQLSSPASCTTLLSPSMVANFGR